MKMAAAGGDGDDVQIHTKESIAQDFGDGIDCSFFLRVTISFSSLLWIQPCTEPPSSERETMDGSKAFKLHINHRIIWAHLISSSTCSKESVCVEIQACAMDPMQVLPAG